MIKLVNLPLPCPENRRLKPGVRKTKSGSKYQGLYRTGEADKKGHKFIFAIWQQLGGRPRPLLGPCRVKGQFWYARKSSIPDCDAYTKEIMDLLTKAGIWKDDTQCVASPSLERMGPQYPGHVDLEIWEVENDQES